MARFHQKSMECECEQDGAKDREKKSLRKEQERTQEIEQTNESEKKAKRNRIVNHLKEIHFLFNLISVRLFFIHIYVVLRVALSVDM